MAWYGNSAAHAAAGRIGGKKQGWKSNPGNFRNDPKKAVKAGILGARARKLKARKAAK